MDQHFIEIRFSQQVKLIAALAQSFGPHLDLLRALFARHVEHRPVRVGDLRGDLHQQCRFADARITAD